jgi:predicted nucleic acid-binding protein
VRAVVVDASVAAKWVLPREQEALVEEATEVLNDYIRQKIKLLVPDLFWIELANVLCKAIRRGRCSQVLAETALKDLTTRQFTTIPSSTVLESAFRIASMFDRSVYDSAYIAVALEFSTHMITADEKLANAVAAHLPVKWLGALIRPVPLRLK